MNSPVKENKHREETVRAGVQAAIVGVGAHLPGEKQSIQMWGTGPRSILGSRNRPEPGYVLHLLCNLRLT